MATYILDTNTISYLWDSKSIFHKQIKDKLYSLNNSDNVATTALSQDAILVSNDKLFKVLADNTNLKYENWIED